MTTIARSRKRPPLHALVLGRVLLRGFVTAVVVLTAFAIHLTTKIQNGDDTTKAVLPTHDNALPARKIAVMSATTCDFGTCLTWNNATEKSCANLYPIKWQQTHWDTVTKQLYEKHKRTMHFEVINIRQRQEGLDMSDTTNTTTVCQQQPTTAYPYLLTYFHIFKNGGTTMRNAFRNYGKSIRQPYQNPDILFTGIQRHIGTEGFHQRLNETVLEIHRLQQQSSQNQVAAFTFLREPISRFLSGLGQVLNKYKTNKVPKDFPLNECFVLKDTAKMLDCTLHKMMAMFEHHVDTDGYPNQFIDFHLLPQAFLLRDFTGEQDIVIQLMDMSHIQPMLEMLLPRISRTKFQARPSRGEHYTGGHELSMDVLTSQQRMDICRLYKMDVELIRKSKVIRDDDNPCLQLLGL